MQVILYGEDNSGISELLKKIISANENKEIVIIDRLLIDDSFLCVYFDCSDLYKDDNSFLIGIEFLISKNISRFKNTENNEDLMHKQYFREKIADKGRRGKLFIIFDRFDCFPLANGKLLFYEWIDFLNIYPKTNFIFAMKTSMYEKLLGNDYMVEEINLIDSLSIINVDKFKTMINFYPSIDDAESLKNLPDHYAMEKHENFVNSLSSNNVEKFKTMINFYPSIDDAESLKSIDNLINERLIAFCRYKEIKINEYENKNYELKDLFVSPVLEEIKVSFDENNKNDWIFLAENYEGYLKFMNEISSNFLPMPFDRVIFEKESAEKLQLFRKYISANFPVNEYEGVSFFELKKKINFAEKIYNHKCYNDYIRLFSWNNENENTNQSIDCKNDNNIQEDIIEIKSIKLNLSRINPIRLLLLGEQGSGKTTLVKRITLAYAENDCSFINNIGLRENMSVIYIDCKHIIHDDYFLYFEDLILNAVERMYLKEISENIELRNKLKYWMLSKVKEGDLLIVIDNYENVYKEVDLKLFEIEFYNFVRDNPKLSYIISARNEYLENIIEAHSQLFIDCDGRKIGKYNNDQIDKLMQAYLSIRRPYFKNGNDEFEFLRKIFPQEYRFIKNTEMFCTPLSIENMILNLRNTNDFPTCRYDLYEEYISRLININIGNKYSVDDIMMLMGCIAYKCITLNHLDNCHPIHIESFRNIVKDSICDLKMRLSCDIDTNQFIRFITVKLPFINSIERMDVFPFWHGENIWHDKPTTELSYVRTTDFEFAECIFFRDKYMELYFAVNAYKNDYLQVRDEYSVNPKEIFIKKIAENGARKLLIQIIGMICERYDSSDLDPILNCFKSGKDEIAKILKKTLYSQIIIDEQDRKEIIKHTLNDNIVTENDIERLIHYILENPNNFIEEDISEIFSRSGEEDNFTYEKVYSVILMFNLLSEGVSPIDYVLEEFFIISSVENRKIHLHMLQNYLLLEDINMIYFIELQKRNFNIIEDDSKLIIYKLENIIRKIIKCELVTKDTYMQTLNLINRTIDFQSKRKKEYDEFMRIVGSKNDIPEKLKCELPFLMEECEKLNCRLSFLKEEFEKIQSAN